MHNGFQDLINAIEKLTGKTFPKVDKKNFVIVLPINF